MNRPAQKSGVWYNVRIFLRLQRFLLPYWRPASLTYILLFISSASALVVPWLVGRAVDELLASATLGTIVTLAGWILAAAIIRGATSYGQSYFSQAVSQRVAYDLRNAMYDRFQRQSFSFFDTSRTAELMSRATADVESVRMLISFALVRIVQVAVLLLMVTAVLLQFNWQLALVTLAVLPFIAYRTTRTSRRLRPIWLSVQQEMAALSTVLQESLSGVRVVKAFGREKEETERFSRQAYKLYEQNITANDEQAVNTSLMTFSVYFAVGIQLLYGGFQVLQGAITPGELTSFLLYLLTITVYIRMIGWLGNQLSRAVASGERIFEILDARPEVREKDDASDDAIVSGRISFDEVSFGYGERDDVLRGVSFVAEPGQVIAVVGATGSGKTTLVSLIPRFYDPTRGSVVIDGVDVRDMSLDHLRGSIGLVQQDVFLFSATIRDNIAYGQPDAPDEEIIAAASAARLDSFIRSLPDQYGTWVGERGINLSGGQRQRLAIARTLLLDPRILILDDSLSSVDADTEHSIQQALDRVMEGRTTIIVAQRLASVLRADRILVLDEGRIVQQGTHAELVAIAGPYRQIYELQLRHQEEAHAAPTAAAAGGVTR